MPSSIYNWRRRHPHVTITFILEMHMNIVLIVSDTLRWDHLGASGNTWIHTPNLDRLAAQSVVFERVHTGSFPTIPHRTDMVTGTPTTASTSATTAASGRATRMAATGSTGPISTR